MRYANHLRSCLAAAVFAWHAGASYAQQSVDTETGHGPPAEEAVTDGLAMPAAEAEDAGTAAQTPDDGDDRSAEPVDGTRTLTSEAPEEIPEAAAPDQAAEPMAQTGDESDERAADAEAMASETQEGTPESAGQAQAVGTVTEEEPAAGAGSATGPDVDELLERAQAAFDIGDLIAAMASYRKAAELGDALAQTRLGYLLDQAEENEEAAQWLAKAAAQGYPQAAYYLAGMYVSATELVQDYERAVELYESAAAQGHALSIQVLANAYEKGDMKLVRSYDKAVAWLRAGVEAGDAWSIQRLSRAYRNGDLGLRIDEQKAGELEALAARQPAQTE